VQEKAAKATKKSWWCNKTPSDAQEGEKNGDKSNKERLVTRLSKEGEKNYKG